MMAIYLEEAAEILFGALQIGTPIVSRIDDQRGLLRVLPAAPHCEIINL
jgi:hypothetical protein